MMPPRNPFRLLRSFCRPEYLADVEGDLIEMWEKRVKEKGSRRANLLLWRDVLLLLRPGMIKNFLPKPEPGNIVAVAQHNLLISFRSLIRNRTAFFINLGSLSIGFTCVLLIYAWIAGEMSIDNFHDKRDRIYQVYNRGMEGSINANSYLPTPLAEAMASALPEIEYAVSINPFVDIFGGPGIISYNKKDVMAQGFFASDDLFKVFSFRLLMGDNRGVMISKSLAKKLFGSETNAIGKVVDWTHSMYLKGPFEVTGVFDDIPENSTLQFDVVFRSEKMVEGDSNANEWNGGYAKTIILLREGTDIDAFNKKIAGFVTERQTNKPVSPTILAVFPFKDIYLHSDDRMSYIRLFSLVGIFTLAIACINFVNLSTAQASRKLKEVGVKKTLGVGKSALVGQFLTESILIAFVSAGIAMLVARAFHPWMFAFALVVGILAGSYPAFFLSSFRPASVLKGNLSNSRIGGMFIRNGLVTLQFTISIVFIIAFMIVNRQIHLLQTRDLGYSKENVIQFQRKGPVDYRTFESFFNELKSIPGVINVSGTSGSILNKQQALHNGYEWDGATTDTRSILIPSPYIAHDYIETLGIELKEGRTFQKDRANEDKKIILNESAVKMMGFKDPVGQVVRWGTDRLEVIGVVKDFQYGSLHTKLGPVLFMYGLYRHDIILRLAQGFDRSTLDRIQAVYNKFHPGYPFEFTFLDDNYNRLYASEQQMSKMSTYFAIVATLISCLGLFGLAVFSSERRTKEIGIRKVLGASTTNIVRLLGGIVVRPVFIAILIAVPVSYMLGRNWLASFAYRIELSWWFFVGAGVIALVVTWITVGLQTLKAAKANPVDALKTE